MCIAPALKTLLLPLSLSVSVLLESHVRATPTIPSNSHSSIVYVNREYGFRFSLPKKWKRYSVTVRRTEGDFGKVMPAYITIRNPSWTRQDPHEDIPVMVFAIDAWPNVANGTTSVSAAPFHLKNSAATSDTSSHCLPATTTTSASAGKKLRR